MKNLFLILLVTSGFYACSSEATSDAKPAAPAVEVTSDDAAPSDSTNVEADSTAVDSTSL